MKFAKTMLVGAGVATLLGSIAGAYFLYGSKNASKNRRKVRAWSIKTREEIYDKYKTIKNKMVDKLKLISIK